MTTRDETFTDAIASIVQAGHVERKTSEEVAVEIVQLIQGWYVR